jgi:arabinose-5-phosphate isomerase
MTLRDRAKAVLTIEARALRALAERLDENFDRATELIRSSPGRVVLTGIGKSGLVARKIAATFASTGTPALFLHPAEARHGDLGVVLAGDVVIAVSHSGETGEILALLETIRRLGARLIAMTGQRHSTLAREADLLLDTSVEEEGCPLGLAPMASTTAALALGDALAAALMVANGFGESDFALLHPGGKLGRKLARVESLMHSGERMPRVLPSTEMKAVVLEMSRGRMGCTAVVDRDGQLLGLITDGDLRRLLEREINPLQRTAEQVMTRQPVTIAPNALASAALRVMEERKITMLPVVDDRRLLLGLLQIHDLWTTGQV